MFLGITVILSSCLIVYLVNAEAILGSRGAGGGEARGGCFKRSSDAILAPLHNLPPVIIYQKWYCRPRLNDSAKAMIGFSQLAR